MLHNMSGNLQGRLERRNKSRQIADLYLNLIYTGSIAPGERLPGRGEIERVFDVGPWTAQQALVMLRESGLVRAEQGHGSYVISAGRSTA
jgi:DNA-binding GntR family transcriptional regulator